MSCPHCHALCHYDDHRCTRCQRRLGSAADAAYGRADSAYALAAWGGSDAPSVSYSAVAVAEPVGYRMLAQAGPETGYGRELSRVPSATFGSLVTYTVDTHLRGVPARAAAPASPEAVLYCDAPVAGRMHRSLAGAADAAVVLAATGLFLGTLWFAGVEFVLNRSTVPCYAAALACLHGLYRLLWALADGDTPGMRACEVQVLQFDGRRPSRQQRVKRVLSGALSAGAAGLGYLWSLVDEETLGWHDHNTRTFVSPCGYSRYRR